MRTSRIISICGALVFVAAAASPVAAHGSVSVNGTPIPETTPVMDATIEVTEFRDGTDPSIVKLAPGPKRYNVCVVSRNPIGVFDAELPLADQPDRFTVRVEDGREFGRCLLTDFHAGTKVAEHRRDARSVRIYKYCLRCEGVSTPGR